MIAPKPLQPPDFGVFGQCLKENSARIISECAAAFADEKRQQGNHSILETIQKNVPLLLDELILLLPHVMKGEWKMPPVPMGGIECRAGHRLDVVIKTLGGISEMVVLALLRLKGSVADVFLDDACREVRLFFDLKVANYCLQFVAAQEMEIALRVSQLKEANERLLVATEISRASCRSRVQLLEGVIHELRNCLQSLLLYASSLVEGPRDPGVAEIMERLATNGVHLQKLLDRVQSYSDLLAGECYVQLGSVDVDPFLNELEQRHRALAGTTRTRLICRKADGLTAITTDLNKLNLIADNLVSNAIQAAKAGMVQVEVSDDGPERLLLKVTDDGNGIGLVEARQIFRVMHHVSGSHFTGLKLGLLASRYVTHLLGGEIKFESEVGKGACFRGVLPNFSVQR
ncbi:HAMP domain-containing sensor histidine kinase [Prosthecobacter sp.]|uniref:sensor histidine kinase n=1 Tax=Prosthecobacter sp. TaxID=1965333 RepID=UPI0024896686|nr:HAMP domain-containing sensor histidine kinase [Prosthecobacter sp.]MDI1313618.1 HAMP domain-containing sensor histidine kinase [Prosthecobacter sp.]